MHPRSPVERLLQLFGDVRGGEGRRVLLWSANLFVLLLAYYVLKTVREPMVLASGSAELKAYAAAGQAIVLAVAVPLYALAMARLNRRNLGLVVGGVLVAGLLGFLPAVHRAEVAAPAAAAAQAQARSVAAEARALAAAQSAELEASGVAVAALPTTVAAEPSVRARDFLRVGFLFYLFVGLFSVVSIAQFWSLANDMHRREDGERLFPIVAVGGTIGAASGAAVAGALFAWGATIVTMLWLTIALVVVHFGVAARWLAVPVGAPGAVASPAEEAPAAQRVGWGGGFGVVLRDRYVLAIAALALLLNLVNTTGEYILGAAVKGEAARLVASGVIASQGAFIGAFYGQFFFVVNLVTIALQAFVASRLVRYLGIRGVVLALPIVALGVYGLAALGAGFAVFRLAKMAENATDYSLMNTARAMLWLPTTPEQKYAGKQTVDTFVVRAGDVLSGLLVFVGTTMLAWTAQAFAWFNVAVIAVWLGLAIWLVRAYQRRAVVASEP